MLDGSSQIIDFLKFNIINKYIQNVESKIFIPIVILYFLFNMYNNISFKNRDKLILKLKYGILFNNIHSVMLKGTIISKFSSWRTSTDTLFSDNVRAVWNRINKINSDVFELRECANLKEYDYAEDEDISIKKKNNLFIVDQTDSFFIENDIYGKVKYINLINEDDEKVKNMKIEDVELTLFSFTKTVYQIEEYIKDVCNEYLNDIKNKRNEKRFIYSLKEINSKENIKCWHEQEFNTTRSFDNMFFKDKENSLRQIDFFLNNKDWYIKEGNPYCMGIGLSGLPGTGKTSFIKALAKYLNRHIIVIPLNKIKTENDFYDAYFENKYNQDNVDNITFKDKIIVFEDIDCMSDVVFKRDDDLDTDDNISKDKFKKNNSENNQEDNRSKDNKSDNNLDTFENVMLKTVCNMSMNNNNKKKTDEFTLSFLLNTLDGIFETDGRVLVITSNHYDKLDPALTRPGRIDISIKMGKLNYNTINKIYEKYFGSKIPKKYYNNLKNIEITPCEFVNLKKYLNINKKEFIDKLITCIK